MGRPHFEHRVFNASVCGPRVVLSSPVLRTYYAPGYAPVALSGDPGVVLGFPVGEQTCKGKGGLFGEKPIESLISRVHCTESFGVWSDTSPSWQATFPRFPEM